MNRTIRKVAVLGSGIMGSRIACLFASIGVRVLLLDMVPVTLNEEERSRELTLNDPQVRNRLVNASLDQALKSKPSPLFLPEMTQNITLGNFSDDLSSIRDCDWIIEVVVENLQIKRSLFAQVEPLRQAGTLISSNTSGIPIHRLSEGLGEDFRKHFCGTHFFNPPRYLRLLEIIPTSETLKEIVEFLTHYGDLFLGKKTVLCKDTPAFIANRVGVFSILEVFSLMKELELNIDEVDALTGPLLGRPKSATFRTSDVVGIDTLVKVAGDLEANCPLDEARDLFHVPDWLRRMVEMRWLGDKTGQGFYKKGFVEGKKEVLTLDLETMEYLPRKKVRFPSVETAKGEDDVRQRIRLLFEGKDKAGSFIRNYYFRLFRYVSHRIPEISNNLYQIDDAMKAGFGWEYGPFEIWDYLGLPQTIPVMDVLGLTPATWVKDLPEKGNTSFYKILNGRKLYWDPQESGYLEVPGLGSVILLENLSLGQVWKNNGCTLTDIGDGILNLGFHTKMNIISTEVLQGLNKAIDLAERDFQGLVIGNESSNFSAGANVGLILMLATDQDWEELDLSARAFQNTSMRIRYSSIPVIAAPHGLTLGGGCEFCLHADRIQAAAETYMGLVEIGVGIIPAGGGTKEMTRRASEEFVEGEIELLKLQERFLTIAKSLISSSAHEAYKLWLMRYGNDAITLNKDRLIADAKREALHLAGSGYIMPTQGRKFRVLGQEALGAFLTGINGMRQGNFITEYDSKIIQKLAFVMAGGDLSEPSLVSEQYLLDLEREAFLSLCGEPKTLERMQGLLSTGRPVRN